MKLRKLIAAVAGLSLLAAAPSAADARWHGGGYHHGGGHFGTGLAVGVGIGALGGYVAGRERYDSYNHNWYHRQPYYDAPYYYSRPACPYGYYAAESPYRPNTWICIED